MTSISQSNRYFPHEINTMYCAVKLFKSGYSYSFVCRRYKISKSSLMRWSKRFDGTKQSLLDKSHRPLMPHPNAHTEEELKWIKDYLRRNHNISMSELYSKLRVDKGYSRHACSLFRVMRKMGYFVNKEKHIKYNPKPYDTPKQLGVKCKWMLNIFLKIVILVMMVKNFINIP